MICRSASTLSAAVVMVAALATTARADDLADLRAAQKEFDKLYAAGRHREAEPYARKMLAIAERSFQNDPKTLAAGLVRLGFTYHLEHPGIVPVYGFGCERRADGNDYPYYAMRFIRGERLEDAIRRFHDADWATRDSGQRTLELQKLLRSFLAVCNTVAYAHNRGVIHRDLKPANIMLGPYGETLVVDWGLAKMIGDGAEHVREQPAAAAAAADFGATLPGLPKGTLAYMSPEQAAGDWAAVGPASDLYSLGVILYSLLTGRKAFDGNSGRDMFANVKAGCFRPPREVDHRVPPALEAICLKAMRRRPADRYATSLALAEDIEHWLADEPVTAWREPWTQRLRRWSKRHRTMLAGGLAALVVAAIGLGSTAWLLGHKNSQLQVANGRAEQNFELAHNAVRELVKQAGGNSFLQRPGMHRAQESLLRVALKYYRDFWPNAPTIRGCKRNWSMPKWRWPKSYTPSRRPKKPCASTGRRGSCSNVC